MRYWRTFRPKEKALWVSFSCEIGWASLAILSALLANSIVLWANAFRVTVEALLCFLALYGTIFLLSQNKCHPKFEYGLGKIENVFSLLGGVIAFLSFLFIGWQAIERFQDPRPTEGALVGIIVLVLASSHALWLYFQFRTLSTQENSPMLHTLGVIYRNATIASLTALVSVLVPTLFPHIALLYYLDPVGAVVLCAFLLQTTFSLIRNSLFHLLDGALEESHQLQILQTLTEHFEAYEQLHHIRSRRAGALVFVELFLEFDPQLPHRTVLECSVQIKQSLESKISSSIVWIVPVGSDFKEMP
ncbi:MAG: cation diffusion facilitator family transporter [Opitutales bacterium]|nr:cation diffusion facilitator family transporter [Opitutales bacterium]